MYSMQSACNLFWPLYKKYIAAGCFVTLFSATECATWSSYYTATVSNKVNIRTDTLTKRLTAVDTTQHC